jgi:putative membrane protein
MTDAGSMKTDKPRKPQVFKVGATGVSEVRPEAASPDFGPEPASGAAPPPLTLPKLDVERGFRWGALLFGALTAAATFALTLWFYRLVAIGLWSDDWIGWTMRGLVGLALLAFAMLLGRELVGFSRLGRLNRLKVNIAKAISARDAKREAAAVSQLLALYGKRSELGWAVQRLKEHSRDVHDPGNLLALADRDLMAEIDGAARRVITVSARRVATVTALSPMALLTVGYVAVENMRLLRRLAALYGGRPGIAGMVALARRVFVHLVATGGIALTDDLLGQFIGQDLVRRLSRRLGEGVFNGALTARVGVAAIDIIRPLPFIEARPVRVRAIVAEAFKAQWASTPSKVDDAVKVG